ncbi:MAG: yajO, partial [Paenibacillus sp.]|nr:yajO [Paenibacillus sp.]
MEYVKLGNTGLDVSRICLGCMSFGDAERWTHPWVLNEENSRPIIKKALDLGINFFDTANIYSTGSSEEIIGRALKDYANRDEVVIATKVHFRMHEGPNGAGLSRKAIMSEIDKSLKRLGTDYVDLYQIHRWDYNTPIEETMEALHDVVKAGKARYIGASAMYAWQFLKALHVAERNGWTRFVSMQNHMNLIYREEEREMMPLCKEEKIGVIPYSPIASGRLARDKSVITHRSETDQPQKWKYDASESVDRGIIDRVAEIAEQRGVPRV